MNTAYRSQVGGIVHAITVDKRVKARIESIDDPSLLNLRSEFGAKFRQGRKAVIPQRAAV